MGRDEVAKDIVLQTVELSLKLWLCDQPHYQDLVPVFPVIWFENNPLQVWTQQFCV